MDAIHEAAKLLPSDAAFAELLALATDRALAVYETPGVLEATLAVPDAMLARLFSRQRLGRAHVAHVLLARFARDPDLAVRMVMDDRVLAFMAEKTLSEVGWALAGGLSNAHPGKLDVAMRGLDRYRIADLTGKNENLGLAMRRNATRYMVLALDDAARAPKSTAHSLVRRDGDHAILARVALMLL